MSQVGTGVTRSCMYFVQVANACATKGVSNVNPESQRQLKPEEIARARAFIERKRTEEQKAREAFLKKFSEKPDDGKLEDVDL